VKHVFTFILVGKQILVGALFWKTRQVGEQLLEDPGDRLNPHYVQLKTCVEGALLSRIGANVNDAADFPQERIFWEKGSANLASEPFRQRGHTAQHSWFPGWG
jgi:hypothetical protein